jgi:hypothetical protein
MDSFTDGKITFWKKRKTQKETKNKIRIIFSGTHRFIFQ